MESLKIGMIGAGAIAQEHIKVLKQMPGMKVVGVVTRHLDSAKAFADSHAIGYYSNHLKSMMDVVKPDALMVLASVDEMFKVTQEAITYRVPLFIEKPAGMNAAENLQLAQAAKKHNTPTLVGFNRRYYSIFHKGLEIIRQYGPLMGVMIEGHERMWRIRERGKFSEKELESWIFANSIHTIDLMRFFGGETVKVSSLAHRYYERMGDQFAAVMELSSGAIGHYVSHWYSPGGWRVVLFGDKVTVEFKPLENGIWIDRDFKPHEIAPDDEDVRYKAGFYRQMTAFENMIRTKVIQWPDQDLEGSYRSMVLAEELIKNVSDKTHLKKDSRV